MATRISCALPRRPTAPTTSTPITSTSAHVSSPSHTPLSHTPSRAATMIRRPRRPYTFTQMIVQTDGSTYTMRTTSPVGMYRSTKDTLNHLLWQPSNRSLRNVEVDEAGKLASFRSRFGRGWDVDRAVEAEQLGRLEAAAVADDEGRDMVEGPASSKPGAKKDPKVAKEEASAAAPPQVDSLSDLIASYGAQEKPIKEPKPGPSPEKKK
ncbi:hypothetical protein GGR52DRAFT_175681 [Hypoxylon sp. FL1284]|nr:hypothetical protein GGR52DRAFT_175681 [Hypoxylon sp. FL1284]